MILSIQDDGRGFDTSTVKAYTGHGLQNMQERARALDAQLRIDSTPGQGTLVEVKLPVAEVTSMLVAERSWQTGSACSAQIA